MTALGGGGAIRRRPWWQEFVLVVLVVLSAAMSMSNHVTGDPRTRFTIGGFLLPVAVCVLLFWRRRAPLWTVGVITVVTVVYQAKGLSVLAFIPALTVAMYTVARHYDRKPAWTIGSAVILCAVVAALLWGSGAVLGPQRLAPLAWIALATAMGDSARTRYAYVAALEERAMRAELTQEKEAERRVAEERMRIASELHDVVAHELTLINAQAGIAAHLGDRAPAMTAEVLVSIRDSSKQALDELRAVVGLLNRPGEDPDPPREPVPGLDRLGDLVESFARAGLRVDVEQVGGKRPMPLAVDVAGYRIIQEALTNVRKHAGVEHARVRLHFGHDSLRIVVQNDPPEAVVPVAGVLDGGGTGRGLMSMRERSAAVGGRITVGPGSSGGFTVEARLPLGRARTAGRETP